jgi:hypothetical protein
MERFFFITDKLENITQLESTLKEQGLSEFQYHTLSADDMNAERLHVHGVGSILKRDLLHSAEIGALVGLCAAGLIMGLAYAFDWTNSALGWIPFIFISVLAFGFCTWEGAFLGMQTPNKKFQRFQSALSQGRHVFFVDVSKQQERLFKNIMKWHPQMEAAGTGSATPAWVLKSQDGLNRFIKAMP